MSDAGHTPSPVRTIAVPRQALGDALTSDGRYLLVADGVDGATVIDVARITWGAEGSARWLLERAASPR